MKKIAYIIFFTLTIVSCNSKIKNTEAKIEIEEGTEVIEEKAIPEEYKKNIGDNSTVKSQNNITVKNKRKLLGTWVGYFEQDRKKGDDYKSIDTGGEGFYWNRDNKINISIDNITDSLVTGHSVVAGNNRPFKGIVRNGEFEVEEPGDDKYDGVFKFKKPGQRLIGTWSAYKDIDIKHRKFSLSKMDFSYNQNIMLERTTEYIDWNKFTEEKTVQHYGDGDFEEWVKQEFASATKLIYSINASNTLLNKKDVENLKKGDITIIRNTIYARHGYSFKNRPLRVFFDAQDWYIPIHTDIKSNFTDIEKKNIKLLLLYEKNALEYYDYFGRG